ncbi:MAG: YdiY family protein [Verrucomicrobiota bacterium]
MNKNLWQAVALTAAAFTPMMAEDAPEDPTAWKVSAGVNFAVAKGNTDTLLAGANILGLKKWDKNEFTAGADGTYGDNTDIATGVKTTTAQNYGGFLQYNRLFSERLYGYARGDARVDEVANINYRFQLSPGVGYYLIKNDRTTLSGEAGPGVVFEQLEGVDSAQYFTVRLGEKFTHKFNERVRLMQDFEILPQVDRWENYVVNASATVEADLTKKLATRLTVQDNYRSEPAPGRKNNDVRVLAGLAYKF